MNSTTLEFSVQSEIFPLFPYLPLEQWALGTSLQEKLKIILVSLHCTTLNIYMNDQLSGMLYLCTHIVIFKQLNIKETHQNPFHFG